MANAMVALASLTLGSAQATVTFSSIPTGAYRDLFIETTEYWSSANTDVGIRFNGTTGTSTVYMAGFGSSSSSGTSSDLLGYASATGTQHQIHIFDAFATDKHKSGVYRYDNPGNFTAAAAFRWASTAAITSIQFYVGTGNFAAGSTFALYGVVA